MRLSGHAHGIVTKTVHRTLPGDGGTLGVVGNGQGRGWWGRGGVVVGGGLV